MIRNYLKTALRIMLRQKAYAAINVTGLSIGIATSLIIIIYIADELGYDGFHKDAEQIYRVGFSGRLQGNEFNSAISSAPAGEAMQREIPGVTESVRFGLWRTMPISYEEKNFTEKYFLVADSNFFKFFSFPLLKGNPETVLKGTNKVVLTESVAKKYFGDENPLGKILLGGAERNAYEVTGVAQDPPANSHITFDMILSGESWEYLRSVQWSSNNIYTYVKIQPGTNIEEVRTQLHTLVEKNMGRELQQFLGIELKDFIAQGNRIGMFLQPMLDIRLHSTLSDEITPNGNIQYIYIFGSVAIFIILIACINFMNLSTARSANRAKEVGVRKTIGAVKHSLVFQFIAESLLYSFCSTILAVILITVSLEMFNTLAGKNLTLTFFAQPLVIGGLILFSLIVGLIAGSYPAFYLTAFKPTEVLKGKIRAGFKNSALRNGMVVFQFMISIALIFGSIVIYHQLKYVQEKNLGFQKENVISVLHTMSLGLHAQSFKNEVAAHPQFKGASFANRLPPNIDWNSAFRKGGSEQDYLLSLYFVDHDHLKTMGYTLVEGRFFSKEFPSDTAAIIINETTFKHMGFTSLEEASIISYNGPAPRTMKVIGILKDFNFESLKASVRPLAMLLGPEPNFEMALRLTPGNTQEQLQLLESIWKKHAPGAPFEYSFVDQNFDALFRAEQRLSNVIFVFTILAIGIACLGLFGLATFTAEQRAKEISIRKVMGASVSQLLLLLSKDFTILVVVAFVIATPIAWFMADNWLAGFANRIALEPWFVVASGLVAVLIASFTIIFQSIKAASANPVNAMRSE